MKKNGYNFTKQIFDFAFENPDIINPTVIATYLYLVEINNRLGWKEVFSVTSRDVMDAIGIKNYKTFRNAFDFLVKFGFVEIEKKAINQYQPYYIKLIFLDNKKISAMVKNTRADKSAVVNFDRANSNALVKNTIAKTENKKICSGKKYQSKSKASPKQVQSKSKATFVNDCKSDDYESTKLYKTNIKQNKTIINKNTGDLHSANLPEPKIDKQKFLNLLQKNIKNIEIENKANPDEINTAYFEARTRQNIKNRPENKKNEIKKIGNVIKNLLPTENQQLTEKQQPKNENKKEKATKTAEISHENDKVIENINPDNKTQNLATSDANSNNIEPKNETQKTKKSKSTKINSKNIFNKVPEIALFYGISEGKAKAIALILQTHWIEKSKSYTPQGFKILLRKLNNLAGGDVQQIIPIVEQSIANNWQGYFELKNKPKNYSKIQRKETDF